jgi:hypothetical protein
MTTYRARINGRNITGVFELTPDGNRTGPVTPLDIRDIAWKMTAPDTDYAIGGTAVIWTGKAPDGAWYARSLDDQVWQKMEDGWQPLTTEQD